MKRAIFYGMASLGLGISLTLSAGAQKNDVPLTVTDLGHGLYMMEGAGGNLGLSVGADGAFLIDDQFGYMSDKIKVAVEARSEQPLHYVINTHFHGDHTGGNEAMTATGATIIAQENVRTRLLAPPDRGDGAPDPAPAEALPIITFSERVNFYWNDHTIQVTHPLNAHTDGDAVIYFADANVLHMGDTYFAKRWPFIDLAAGGSIAGYIKTLEDYAAKIDDDTKIIPGHGPLSNRAEMLAMANDLKKAQSLVLELKQQGLEVEAILAAKPLEQFSHYDWRFIDQNKMVVTILQDAK